MEQREQKKAKLGVPNSFLFIANFSVQALVEKVLHVGLNSVCFLDGWFYPLNP